ncbi:membrane protein of unknown function [Nitrospira japonica]|uniref:Uncharacterized protein n=1 Tax=Nitrospira japonica TaxID=1325564 RepID=A0A1W1I6S2_9BACT|nr:membrane protein of unknown function [Nitrospira japonica]
MLTASEYGVFAPLVAIISTIMAAGAAVILLWAGPLEKWRPADADLPGMAKRIIFLACSVVMVLLALESAPQNLEWMKETAWWLLGVWVVLGIVYSALRYGLYHSKVNPNGKGRKPILGGLWMRAAAKTSMKQNKITEVDDLLDGAPGPQAIWSGPSRFLARVLILGMFIVFVVSATTSLMAVGLITYVKTTGKALF